MIHSENPDALKLDAAAAALIADPALDRVGAVDGGVLRYLGYDDGDMTAAPGRARMLRAAAMLRRLFLLPVPDAPGLVFFGGEADPATIGIASPDTPVESMAGSGLKPSRAFEACVGEAVEFLSQFVGPHDRIERRAGPHSDGPQDISSGRFIAELLASCNVGADQPIDWVAARAVTGGSEAWFPADLCLRRPATARDFAPPFKLSTGCAAGATLEDAALRALLELIERDAAALWWRGGRRGRAIPADGEAGHAAVQLLAALRQANEGRRTWLLDITTDLGVPVVAAASCGTDGYGFAFGLGCRLSQSEAARAAIFEMCQVELGPHVVAAKRQEAGDDALQEGDLRHLRRTTLIDTRTCVLLQPSGVADAAQHPSPTDPAVGLQLVNQRLAGHGITAFWLNLTRDKFAIPVVRMLAPGLQLEPSRMINERLAAAICETGGGATHTRGLSLL